MWGWLVIEEPHDLRDMILLVTMNAKRMGEASLKPKGPVRMAVQKLKARLDGINLRGSAAANAEHCMSASSMKIANTLWPTTARMIRRRPRSNRHKWTRKRISPRN